MHTHSHTHTPCMAKTQRLGVSNTAQSTAALSMISSNTSWQLYFIRVLVLLIISSYTWLTSLTDITYGATSVFTTPNFSPLTSQQAVQKHQRTSVWSLAMPTQDRLPSPLLSALPGLYSFTSKGESRYLWRCRGRGT